MSRFFLLEPEEPRLTAALDRDDVHILSAASLFETSMVIESRTGERGLAALDQLILDARVEVVPFDGSQLAWARYAFRTYGKGRHPAGLNFGDCFSYALSKVTGEPLLFVGADFARTDIEAVAW